VKLVSLKDRRLGVVTSQGVVLPEHDGLPKTIKDLLEGGAEARTRLEAYVSQANNFVSEEDLELGPCVPEPSKIVCVGLNYRRHAAEAGMAVPTTPILFSKYSNTLAAHGDAIMIPKVTKQADYEAELAVVMGKRAQQVTVSEALGFVFGYCNANDLSARDLQLQTSQWLLGKTLDGFLPLGPYLVTADEVRDPNTLKIRTWRNSELRQDSSTSDMVFSVAEIVNYVSHYLTLEAGDVILTGTPEGVIFGDKPPVWLSEGDEVTVEIEKLGRLTNTFYNEV
jgi:2-keto-4-pentenoate hydratase/2-oxohepta-3-ene-1,7-dioic acid hydratase in catechol pathway